MSFAALSMLSAAAPLRLLFAHAGEAASLSLAGFAAPWQAAARLLGPQRLQVEVVSMAAAQALPVPHIGVLLAEDTVDTAGCRALATYWQAAQVLGASGAAVLACARAGLFDGRRAALPWQLYGEAEDLAERVVFTPQLYELEQGMLSCCGGAAALDCALTLLEAVFGADLQAQVREELCVAQVRGPAERQRMALQARFGALQPRLAEAVTLMEANIEEPLSTDEIAGLVGISRRQLERQFKQYLDSMPSRYYLELRLQRARRLLMETNDSIVQVGLQCGFSSGSHFSTAYGAHFGITPREERQRRLRPASPT